VKRDRMHDDAVLARLAGRVTASISAFEAARQNARSERQTQRLHERDRTALRPSTAAL
jgi:hypothetical protein